MFRGDEGLTGGTECSDGVRQHHRVRSYSIRSAESFEHVMWSRRGSAFMSEEKGVRVESLFFLSNRVYMYKESTQE